MQQIATESKSPALQTSSTMSDLKDYVFFMLQYAKDYKLRLLILVFIIIVFIISGRLIPLIFGWAVDYGIKKENIHYIYMCGGALIICNALRGILSFFISFQFRFIGQNILYKIRRDLIAHVQNMTIAFFDKNSSGRVVTRISNDTRSLGDLFSEGLSGILINIIEVVSIIFSLFFISWHMAIAVMFTLPPVLWASKYLSEKIRIQFILIKSKLSTINAFSAENLNGIQILQLYGGEKLVLNHFDSDVNEYRDLQLKSISYFAMLWPIIEFFQLFSILISLVIGVYLINQNLVSIGEIGAFVLMLQGFFRPLRFIIEKYNQVQNGITSSQRIIRLFREKTELQALELKPNQKLKDLTNTDFNPGNYIEVKNLNFSYDGKRPILKDICFNIGKSTKTSIVGHTGSGKTTLISLLQGFYNAPVHSIFIQGMPLENIKLDSLRKKLLVVRQDEFIFKGTLEDNLIIGNNSGELTKDKLNAVLIQIGLNLNLDTPIDEMGANLSAGEKQLIALARVMIYDPEIIILDEATSHIDSVSEQKVLSAFDKVLENRTSIIIAHRLTTVLKSDQVLVLDEGQIIEKGSPKALLEDPSSNFARFYNELL